MSKKQTLVPNMNLDENWVSLMIAARDLGLTTEEVRQFFRECEQNDEESIRYTERE
ncbi:anti-repressor SinI family protein [Paenibacillus hamazuiensis]|uniref:anti-repressor SinI family protein n=1 Tax=Paenibacillus hamazuiensis TaxID=2936508 RepID=UPI00200D3246|nr:anti-repressor SinI family protein [Paenibacillus hamazuiensis]